MREDRREDASRGAALQSYDHAEQDRGEREHHVARGERRDGVGHGRPDDRVPGDRGVRGAAEEQLLRHAVDGGDDDEHRQRALGREPQHLLDLVGQQRDVPHDESAHDEHARECQTEGDGLHDGADEAVLVVGVVGDDVPQVEPTGREGADGPDRGEPERERVEPRAAGLDAQRDGEHDGAEHHDTGGHPLAPPERRGRHAVVAGHDLPQGAVDPASARVAARHGGLSRAARSRRRPRPCRHHRARRRRRRRSGPARTPGATCP